MGETCCGKTTLIEKLNKILNYDDNLVGKIKRHPGNSEEEICEKMNEKAKNQKYINEKQ